MTFASFVRVITTCLALLLLGACGGRPDTEVLRKDVEARLAQALPPGAVTLVRFDRRGSQSDTRAPDGESRRIIYFDAQLKLEQDVDFGAWDSPGVAGLVSALGSGPKGIIGIRSGGNAAGDVLRAHGTALYKREADAWVAAAPGGHQPAEAPAYAASEPQRGTAALLEAMGTAVTSLTKKISPAERAVIEEELADAKATIRARLARMADGYALAAGPEHGQYMRFAQALFDEKGTRGIALVTRGGVENLELLRAGKVSLALAQGDSALAAYEGSGLFAESGAHASLRAIGSLYPEPVHVLVRADSSIRAVADLRGSRVAIGVHGSASRSTAQRVLDAHGLSLSAVKALELPLTEALIGMQRREVDAVIQVIGVPADSVRDALAAVPLRLVPLSEAAIASLTQARQGLFAHTIASGTYASQANQVATVATAAVLLVASDLSDAEVAALTRFVYSKGRDFVARGSAQGLQVSAATARQGLTVPPHLAAEKVLGPAPTAPAGAPGTSK